MEEEQLDSPKSFWQMIIMGFYLLKKNLSLLLPPAIVGLFLGIYVLLCLVFLTATFVIIKTIATNKLLFLLFFSILTLIFILGGILIFAINLAGWVNMNKQAVDTEKTFLSDYLEGIKKYWDKMLGGTILRSSISIILAGGVLTFIFIFLGVENLVSSLTEGSTFSDFLYNIKLLAKNIKPGQALEILLVLSLWIMMEVLISFIFSFWKQACVFDKLSVLNSYETSIDFILKNFWLAVTLWLSQLGFIISVAIVINIFIIILGIPLSAIAGKTGFNLVSFPLRIIENLLNYILSVYFMLLFFLVYNERRERVVESRQGN